MYSERLKKLFTGITLELEDLYLLESYQIESLKQFAPKKEFAAILHAHNSIKRFMIAKCPSISQFIETIMREYEPVVDQELLDECIDSVIWELGLMIVSNKFPEEYEKRTTLHWDLTEISSIVSLDGKIVIDVGAGTGNIAFMITDVSKIVYAVEPVTKFREFMKQKAKKQGISNLFVLDGLLNEIPLPENSVDILITSNAIGWSIEEELKEIERVVKSQGYAIHLLIGPKESEKEIEHIHGFLISSEWKYQFDDLESDKRIKRRYWKKIEKSDLR